MEIFYREKAFHAGKQIRKMTLPPLKNFPRPCAHSTTFCFFFINFRLNTDFPSQFFDFYRKIKPNVTQRSVSQENEFNRAKNGRLLCSKL